MNSIMPFLVPIITSLALFTMISWIVWVEARRRQMQSKSVAELQSQLLAKFGSAQEFVQFMQTDEGRRFLATLAQVRLSPAERVLRSIRIGVILTIIGLGWLSLALTGRFDDDGALTVIGVLFLATGIGFLISAAISYRLSKAWGVFTEPDKRNDPMSAL